MTIEVNNPTESKNNYFTEETEKAIMLYNSVHTQEEKNAIYEKYLNYPLKKLIENVIHTYKLYNTGTEYNSFFDQTLEYIIEKLYKIDLEKGKAYSYLTVTAKNYGFMLTKNNYNKNIREFELDDCYELDSMSYDRYNNTEQQESLSEFFNIYAKYMRKNIKAIFTNKEEIQIADILIEFFEERHNIDIFNKKALFIIIKERIKDCETRFITDVNNILKDNFYKMYDLYHQDNNTDFKYYNPTKQPSIKRRRK